jgi:hypothetical protein
VPSLQLSIVCADDAPSNGGEREPVALTITA